MVETVKKIGTNINAIETRTEPLLRSFHELRAGNRQMEVIDRKRE